MNRAEIGCLAVVVVIVAIGVGVVAYGRHYDARRIAGLDSVIAEVRAAAKGDRMASALRSADADYGPPGAGFSRAVGNFFQGPLSGDIPQVSPRQPLFKPPIAVIDLDHRRIDPAQDRLPQGVQADSIATANTLVFVRCLRTKVGEYIFWRAAYTHSCDLVGVDMKADGGPLLLATARFYESPPQSISIVYYPPFRSVIAFRPDELIAGFVKYELGLTAQQP